MRLLIGLGNPGSRYFATRHNLGFLAINAIHRRFGFGPWRDKFQGVLAEGEIDGVKLHLLKPQTFMNLSGDAVGETARFYKLKPSNIAVLHDDIDLAPGVLRVKQGGGHAGHNGLRSLDAIIGPDYWRVRLGIGHPGQRELVEPYVLQEFDAEERLWVPPLVEAVAEAMPHLVKDDASGFTTKVAQILKPNPKNPPPGAPPANGDQS
jgi:PTH1 family peptidyl-tRNA hydrolase